MPTYWGGAVRRGAGMVCIWKESSLAVMNWEAHNRNVHKYFRGRMFVIAELITVQTFVC